MLEEERRPPLRKWGQNFLRDSRAAARIVAAAQLQDGDMVLEIGPGRGALTRVLLDRAPVVAVEIDPRLAADLRSTFAGTRLRVLERDILSLDLEDVVRTQAAPRLVVVGNLPYNISKPVASRLVRDRRHVDRAVLTFQREVADRLVAVPSTRAYGPLTILAGQAYRIERLFDLRPSAFQPAPLVTSSVTRWIRRPDDALPAEEEQPLRACLAACFGMRRRTLFNNLRQAFPEEGRASALLDAAEIDGQVRAEELPPSAFRRLASLWPGR